jgi:hypothetical protein
MSGVTKTIAFSDPRRPSSPRGSISITACLSILRSHSMISIPGWFSVRIIYCYP